MPLVNAGSFEFVQTRPKYDDSYFIQWHALHRPFPMFYFLFARR
jgi:hypothetical protein